MNIDGQVEYPSYLQSLRDFEAYLADQFQGLSTTIRGNRFAEAVLLILPTFREQTDSSATSLTKRRVMIVVLTYSLSN